MQKEETRRAIMAAAYHLFELKGYEKTTMRELALRADVALGTIFQHFPDKPSLLFSAFQEDMEAVIHASLNNMLEVNIRMQLTHIVAELYEFFAGNTVLSRTLIKEVIFLGGNYGNIAAGKLSVFLDTVERLIGSAMERGELRRETDAGSLVMAFTSFFLLGLIKGLHAPEFNAREQTVLFASMLENYLEGWMPESRAGI